MSTKQATLFIDCKNSLGEGPLWHDMRQEYFWFSIHDGELFNANSKGEILSSWKFGEPATAAAIISKDELAVAAASGLIRFNLNTGDKSLMTPIEADDQKSRTNDSRVGPGGGFWISTMSRAEGTPTGAVYHWRNGEIRQIVQNIVCPNSTCFSPDGKIAYFTDTVTGKILKRSIDPETALPTGPFELFRDTNADPGHPDGSIVDAQGFVWNARYAGSCVIRYSPTGEIDRVVDVPVPNVTCPSLGGADLKTMFITTASQGMSAQELEANPNSGSIFKIEVDVPGLPEFRLAV